MFHMIAGFVLVALVLTDTSQHNPGKCSGRRKALP